MLDAFSIACLVTAAVLVAGMVLELLRLKHAALHGPVGFDGLWVLATATIGVLGLFALHSMRRLGEERRYVSRLEEAVAQRDAMLLEAPRSSADTSHQTAIALASSLSQVQGALGAVRSHLNEPDRSTPDAHSGAFNGHPFAAGFPFGFASSASRADGERRVALLSEVERAFESLAEADRALRQREVPSDADRAAKIEAKLREEARALEPA